MRPKSQLDSVPHQMGLDTDKCTICSKVISAEDTPDNFCSDCQLRVIYTQCVNKIFINGREHYKVMDSVRGQHAFCLTRKLNCRLGLLDQKQQFP